jgi:hypothetical protein
MISKMKAIKKQISENKKSTLVKNDTAIAMPPKANAPKIMPRMKNKIDHSSIIRSFSSVGAKWGQV